MKPLAAFVAGLTLGVVADVARADRRARLRAEECPVCDGAGGPLLDDWGYERAPCPGGCDTPPATVVPESEAP